MAALPQDTLIISGGAWGVDTFAAHYAEVFGLGGPIIHRPDVRRAGHAKYAIRNHAIVADCDRLVAFWDGVSPGTKMTIGFAENAGKPVEIIDISLAALSRNEGQAQPGLKEAGHGAVAG